MIVCESVRLEDLYHSPDLYSPDCCCSHCLDVSIWRARRDMAASYREMRRSGQGRLARLLWRKLRNAEKAYQRALGESLFATPPQCTIGGLLSLLRGMDDSSGDKSPDMARASLGPIDGGYRSDP